MKIDKTLCVDCGECLKVCSVGGLVRRDGAVLVDLEKCVECHACVRAGVCPTGALIADELEWPRIVRSMFSDPFGKHPSTKHMGRGTEEVKTNDVTNLVTPGYAGIAVEPGRPGVGAYLGDVEKITTALASVGVSFAPNTPITNLMQDKSSGKLREDILGERVLSAIVECTVPLEKLPAVVGALKEVSGKVDTVFTVAVFVAGGPKGDFPSLDYFRSLGLEPSPWGKVNMGLGRATLQEERVTEG
ncbi:MAG: 4Fe-4S dicluster domain-containing protein [Firmicutes bacterium]|nr:4Fe-4S dicluster domain-containing protein [Candidatus Fermentithermobacillaceae bacterium]